MSTYEMELQKKIFAENLKKHLDRAEKTQTDLQKYMGVSSSTASDWMRGAKMPRMDKLQSICNWLGIQKSDLLEEKREVDNTKEQLFELAEDKVIIDMYHDLDEARKEQARSYIGYLHHEWEKESGTEKRTADVVHIKREDKDYLLPNAAHAVNPTPEQKKHADDIMFNDDEWK